MIQLLFLEKVCTEKSVVSHPTMPEFSHFDESGRSRMVDVSSKPETLRSATASGRIRMKPETLAMIQDRNLAKGNVLEVARLGGIMAAKRTGELIPLCHPLGLDSVEVRFQIESEDAIKIEATASLVGRTGVEMEALTAVTVSALTIYDMCKAVDRSMVIEEVVLEQKSGGRSGTYQRSSDS